MNPVTDYYELDWLKWGHLAIEVNLNPRLQKYRTERFLNFYDQTFTGDINSDRKRVHHMEEAFADVSHLVVEDLIQMPKDSLITGTSMILRDELKAQQDDLIENDVLTLMELGRV